MSNLNAAKQNEQSITVWYSNAEFAHIQAYCKIGGFNRSAVIRKALALYMATNPMRPPMPSNLPVLVDVDWSRHHPRIDDHLDDKGD